MTRAVAESGALALVNEGRAILEAAGLPDAGQNAEWLLAAVLDAGRFAMYLDPAREVAAAQVERYRALVTRRAAREPLQHLTGFEEFHGVRLAVTPDVLIPRPETEGLVEWAIELVGGRPGATAADIGTGSGAIACALATRHPTLEVLAIDAGEAALAVAAGNVRANRLRDRVELMLGDLASPLVARGITVDLLVANLPYLPSPLIPSLAPEVARWEPRLALDGGPDGLDVIRRLVAQAPAVLAPGAWLLLEIGEGQADAVASLLAAHGFAAIEARRDLNQVERYVAGRWRGAAGEGPR